MANDDLRFSYKPSVDPVTSFYGVDGDGNLLSTTYNVKGSAANKFAWQTGQDALNLSWAQTQAQNQFNADEAQKARDFSERMVSDTPALSLQGMMKAGYNVNMLSGDPSGAPSTTAASASAQAPAADGLPQSPKANRQQLALSRLQAFNGIAETAARIYDNLATLSPRIGAMQAGAYASLGAGKASRASARLADKQIDAFDNITNQDLALKKSMRELNAEQLNYVKAAANKALEETSNIKEERVRIQRMAELMRKDIDSYDVRINSQIFANYNGNPWRSIASALSRAGIVDTVDEVLEAANETIRDATINLKEGVKDYLNRPLPPNFGRSIR